MQIKFIYAIIERNPNTGSLVKSGYHVYGEDYDAMIKKLADIATRDKLIFDPIGHVFPQPNKDMENPRPKYTLLTIRQM